MSDDQKVIILTEERDSLRGLLKRVLCWEDNTQWLEPMPADLVAEIREGIASKNPGLDSVK